MAVAHRRTDARTGRRTRLLRDVRDVVALSRPWLWPLSLLLLYLGFVLATRRLVPYAAELPELLCGAVVAGPLMWLAVCAVNDAYDVDGDLVNPRKDGPLTAGRVSQGGALWISLCAAALAVLLALAAVTTAFALGTALALALGWVYSAPPVRLKTRPGADVAVNAVTVGGFGPLAGWAAVRPLDGFPWAVAVQGTLVAAALYLPTTLADVRADAAAGYDTVAVRLGPERTFRLGFALWTASAGLAVVLSATDTVLPRALLPLVLVLVPPLVWAYRRLITMAQSFCGVIVLAALFLVPFGAFLVGYTRA